jgi:hypothetical protein
MGWYSYLEERLRFAFPAKCIAPRAISPLRKGQEAEVPGLAPAQEGKHDCMLLPGFSPMIRSKTLLPSSGLAGPGRTQAVDCEPLWSGVWPLVGAEGEVGIVPIFSCIFKPAVFLHVRAAVHMRKRGGQIIAGFSRCFVLLRRVYLTAETRRTQRCAVSVLLCTAIVEGARSLRRLFNHGLHGSLPVR